MYSRVSTSSMHFKFTSMHFKFNIQVTNVLYSLLILTRNAWVQVSGSWFRWCRKECVGKKLTIIIILRLHVTWYPYALTCRLYNSFKEYLLRNMIQPLKIPTERLVYFWSVKFTVMCWCICCLQQVEVDAAQCMLEILDTAGTVSNQC